jgi:hypothetical protein
VFAAHGRSHSGVVPESGRDRQALNVRLIAVRDDQNHDREIAQG